MRQLQHRQVVEKSALARRLVVGQPDQDSRPWQPERDEGGPECRAGTQSALGILVQYGSRRHRERSGEGPEDGNDEKETRQEWEIWPVQEVGENQRPGRRD